MSRGLTGVKLNNGISKRKYTCHRMLRVRGNYLRDQKDSHDKYFEVGVFGFSSIPNRVPMFHFLMEDGGLWWRAPISAFCTKPGVKELPLDELVMWDSFSYNVSVTTFYELAGCYYAIYI